MSEELYESQKSSTYEHKEPKVFDLPKWGSSTTWLLILVVTLNLTLSFIGINWGQPSGYSWHPESAAGL